MTGGKRIHLSAFDMACAGHQSPGLWRHPLDQSHRYRDLRYWTDLARTLERGCFDSLFLGDMSGVYDAYRSTAEAAIRNGAQVPVNDPMLAGTNPDARDGTAQCTGPWVSIKPDSGSVSLTAQPGRRYDEQ